MRNKSFMKMTGAGNDFIVIDGRDGSFDRVKRDFFRRICARGLSVGADGVIIIKRSQRADFKVKFYNSDGSVSRFCGNGSRCAARYAYLNKIAGKKLSFEGDDGMHHAVVKGMSVSISVPHVGRLGAPLVVSAAGRRWCGRSIDVGVPHFVTEVTDVESLNVEYYGKTLRNNRTFLPDGANIDFVQCLKDGTMGIRTYERGVENETLSCGSGCVASSVYGALVREFPSPILFRTHSLFDLKVYFARCEGTVHSFVLEGEARVVFVGKLHEDILTGS